MTTNNFVWQSYFLTQNLRCQFFLSQAFRLHDSFLNIVHDSLFLTNNLTVGKREEKKKLPQNRKRRGQRNTLHVNTCYCT